jgi:hypothetical protein
VSATASSAVHRSISPEPHWPAVAGVVAAAFLPFALPAQMNALPPWLLATIVLTLLAGAIVARHRGNERMNEILGYATLVVLTIAELYGLATLVIGLPHHTEVARQLLRSAFVLWATNVIVFASWYWRLDAGGPNRRARRDAHTSGAFLFPQMAFTTPGSGDTTLAEAHGWQPGFVDYLFLAFNTSTAFSPTDVPVMTRWAKVMMMVQSVISLTTIALLAGRAVNIL